jgi:hypothetical protein
MAFVTVKLSNVQFDFSGSDVDENYMNDTEANYDHRVVEVEVDVNTDDEYFEDYLIEALSDYLSDVSGWCVKDYDHEIVTVR